MSSFSRSALEMLQAAEEALTQPRSVRGTKRPTSAYAYKTATDYDDPPHGLTLHQDPNRSCNNYYDNINKSNCDIHSETSTVRELQSQLSRAMHELIELRAELAAEREHRSETLLALGRQWKEEVMVAVHRRDAALQSDVAALEEKTAAQWKENNESRLVLRRQVEDVIRGAKVRDTDRFQLREELQETSRQVGERVEAALAQSTAVRTDCSRQLEQERAALSQRLDTELLRLVEMRREDQRALQEAKEIVQQGGQRMRDEVRRAVQEVWETSAAALIKTATEPVEQLRAELRQCRTAVQSAEEKVNDCMRTCQAECRLLTTTTAERLHALESADAVAASRVDRAERKADGAYEVVHRMEAAVQAAKDATERAQLQAASALERTQRVEHSLSDRDARLVAVESQLHAVSTAEGLKAEVEACKRQSGRLESRMDVTGALCERVEQLADKTLRQVADFTDRIGSCEKSVARNSESVRGVQEAMVACQAEFQQTRAHHEVSEGLVQRHGFLLTQLEQRIVGQENRLGLWRQQQEQHVKDQQSIQREMTERAEVTHAMATRAHQVSSDARAEVNRLERRFDDVERQLTSGATEATSLRAAVESLRTQGLDLQRQQQQQDDQLRGIEERVHERVSPLADLERTVAQRFERSEGQAERLSQKTVQCEKQIQEIGGRVQDYVKDAIRHHVGESQRRLLSALNDGLSNLSEKVNTLEGTVAEVQARSGDAPQQLQSLRETYTSQQLSLQGVETRLQTLRGQVEQLSLDVGARSGDHQLLGTVQQDVTRLGAEQQRHQQDLLQLRELVLTLREMQLNVGGLTREHALSNFMNGSQAQTASTEMARTTNEGDSSSPSAHIPAGTGARAGTVGPSSVGVAALTQQHQQNQQQKAKTETTVARVPSPLLSTSTKGAPTPQAQQDRQRALSSSTDGSKESSIERPASHLSGVSSVKPAEEVARLYSVVEGGVGTQSSEDGGENEDDSRVVLVGALQSQQTSSRLLSARDTTSAGTTGVDTAEKLSAPAATPSVQVSGIGNTTHQTVIRGFTTIASTSSDSDTERSEGDEAHNAPKHPHTARAEEHTDDVSSDLTTMITLKSEAAATPQRGCGSNACNSSTTDGAAAAGASGGRHVRPFTAQQRRTVTMTATPAWGHAASDSSVGNTPAAPAHTAQSADEGESSNLQIASDTSPSASITGAVLSHRSEEEEEHEGEDSDVVQAVGAQLSTASEDDDSTNGNGLQQQHLAVATQGNAWEQNLPVGTTPLRREQHTSATTGHGLPADTEGAESLALPPRHPKLNDWDEEESDDDPHDDNEDVEAESHRPSMLAHVALQTRVAEADSNDESDMVMQIDEVEEMEDVPPQQRQQHQQQEQPTAGSSDSSLSSLEPSRMAATTVHHHSANVGAADDLRPTARRTFVGPSSSYLNSSPEPRHVVPRHGQNTTSSSSSSAERAEALGLRSAGSAVQGQRPTPQVRHYSNFDDSTTSDDD